LAVKRPIDGVEGCGGGLKSPLCGRPIRVVGMRSSFLGTCRDEIVQAIAFGMENVPAGRLIHLESKNSHAKDGRLAPKLHTEA
jgi:hypothetical protein